MNLFIFQSFFFVWIKCSFIYKLIIEIFLNVQFQAHQVLWALLIENPKCKRVNDIAWVLFKTDIRKRIFQCKYNSTIPIFYELKDTDNTASYKHFEIKSDWVWNIAFHFPYCNISRIFQPCSIPIITSVVWNAQESGAHLRSICTWNVLSVLFYYREIEMRVYCTAALHMWNAIPFTTV